MIYEMAMELWPNRFDIIFSHGLDPWFRHPAVVRSPSWCVGPADSALDLFAGAGAHLLLRIFLAHLPDSRADRPGRNPSCRRLSGSGRTTLRAGALLVCAHAAVVVERQSHADGHLLDRHTGFSTADLERVAAGNAVRLLRLLSFVRGRGPGFFRLSVGRHVAGSRIPLAVLRSGGILAGPGKVDPPSRASLFLLQWEWFRIYFESGMVKLAQRRSGMAKLHRHGRVLPERPVAHLGWLVRATLAALVSCAPPAPRWYWNSGWC